MKQRNGLFILGGLAVLLMFVSPVLAEEQVVKLTKVQGVVEIIPAGQEEGSAGLAGSALKEGDTVKTYEKSSAVVSFEGVGEITVSASSQLVIQKAQKQGEVTETVTNLKMGQIKAKVQKLINSASKFETITPVAVAAVRGTTYIVNVTKDGVTEVHVVEGMVELTSLLTGLGVTIEQAKFSTVSSSGTVSEPAADVVQVDVNLDEDVPDNQVFDPTDVTEDVIEGEPGENPSPSE